MNSYLVPAVGPHCRAGCNLLSQVLDGEAIGTLL